jgi:DNA-directed RNA polymerase specialized sigma24 family protein
MSDDPPANVLMTRAANGDKQAWEALVERYAPLIWSICRRYQLSSADAADIGQAIWLQAPVRRTFDRKSPVNSNFMERATGIEPA